MMRENNIDGFSLVELIIVIIIAGIVAAVAIPRFFNLSEDASSAKIISTANSFATSVNLIHSSWLSKGGSSDITSIVSDDGQTIGVTSRGWAENTNSGGGDGDFDDVSECIELFQGLIKNAPSISASSDEDTSTEFVATVGTGNVTCIYSINGSSDRSFTYNIINGTVTVYVP